MQQIVREWIGYDGLVMSDDLYMEALSGSMRERAGAVIDAGCDVGLYCKGILDEIRQTGEASPVLTGDALRRFKTAIGQLGTSEDFDEDKAEFYCKLLDSLTIWKLTAWKMRVLQETKTQEKSRL